MTSMLRKDINLSTSFNMPVSVRAQTQSRRVVSPVYYALRASSPPRSPRLPNARPIKEMNRVLPLLSELVEIQVRKLLLYLNVTLFLACNN